MPGIEPGQSLEPDTDSMAAIAMEVAASSQVLQAGAIAPAFRLRDRDGRQVSLQKLSVAGPVIVHFYRGSWCSYCQDSLNDLAAAYDDIRAAGGQVVAIAPPPSPGLAERARADAARLPFATLIDHGMKVAVAYGVAYSLPVELRPFYLEHGYAPPPNTKAGEWLVPIPATYLVSPNGTIVLGTVDLDYRNQLHARQLITAIEGTRRRRDALASNGCAVET
ncbi:MAG: alkyl hydroperoxide reductase/Thiol specific antioxidant/Mal allergen [Bradyrhizobium sp.]|nr:alkyl hydroperoxide reductase/Thiol specific antioxidant/Mal allergen [Bradyrhizobium sp.]